MNVINELEFDEIRQPSPSVMLKTPDSNDLSEMIKLGGSEDRTNFVAIRDNHVIGYLWGQVGDGDVYELKKNEMFLEYIRCKEQNVGHGRQIVAAIFAHLRVDTICAETNEDNMGFWIRIGSSIDYSSSDDIREMYEFVLTRESFMGCCL